MGDWEVTQKKVEQCRGDYSSLRDAVPHQSGVRFAAVVVHVCLSAHRKIREPLLVVGGGRSVERILEMKIGTGTVSNAFDMSIAAINQRGAGSRLLRHCRTFCERLVRSVVE